MKFGETLYQRSIPQWSFYNVDYNQLKDLIKRRTANVTTNPVTIPGQGPSTSAWKDLEDELFSILVDQHERCNLFIRSKFGEIERRLNHLDKQAFLAVQRSASDMRDVRPILQTRKYQRLVQDAELIGNEVESLSRFANTQLLAFRKILKKYYKWTGSTDLALRMNNEIFNQPTNMLQLDLTVPLARLGDATSTLNDLSESASSNKRKRLSANLFQETAESGSSAVRLNEASQAGVLEYDAAFYSVPLGHAAGRACYWIHPDNLNESKVLLMRHMKALFPSARPPLSRHASSSSLAASNRPRTAGSEGRSEGTRTPALSTRAHVLMADNLHRFVQIQSSSTISEDREGSTPSRVALSARWADDEDDAIVVVSDLSATSDFHQDRRPSQPLAVSRKDLTLALSRTTLPEVKKERRASNPADLEIMREFLMEHRDVKPMAEIHANRSRYIGLNNNTLEVGTFAILSSDIIMSEPREQTPQPFPHAVLQIRWEFSQVPEVVRAFDTTYLAERVRGFSMESQAIYTVCQPDMPLPLWQPLLEKDIRKVPPAIPKTVVKGSSAAANAPIPSSGPSSTDDPSDSVFSTANARSSATSMRNSIITLPDDTQQPGKAWKVASGKKKRGRSRRKASPQPPVQQRYWNEFDDGDELLDQDSYAIYVTPDEPIRIPGVATASKAFSAMYRSMSLGKSRFLSWLPLQPSRMRPDERTSLLRPGGAQDRDLEDSSGTDSDQPLRAGTKRSATPTYKTMRSSSTATRATSVAVSLRQRRKRRAREVILFRTYVGLFLISFIILGISAILKATGRKKAKLEVDVGVVSGAVAALCCAMIGVVLMLVRKDDVGWLQRGCVGTSFIVSVVGSAILLVEVGGA